LNKIGRHALDLLNTGSTLKGLFAESYLEDAPAAIVPADDFDFRNLE
jgi:hypothetical protein